MARPKTSSGADCWDAWQERLPDVIAKCRVASNRADAAYARRLQAKATGGSLKVARASRVAALADDRAGRALDGIYRFIEGAIEEAIAEDRAARAAAPAAT